MARILLYAAAVGIAIHGLIHLLGLVAYWPLGTLAELPYKTVLMDGRWEVGSGGMRVFAVLWLVAAICFGLAALGMVLGWEGWQPLMGIALVVSLSIAALDWSAAFRGAIIDVILMAGLVLTPLLAEWLSLSPWGKN